MRHSRRHSEPSTMSVAQGMTMVERKNSSGPDENITCISDTSCDTSSSSDNVGSVEQNNCYDDGYIPYLVPPVSHLAPPVSRLAPARLAPASHLAPPVSTIVDSNVLLDVVKKNTDVLHLLLEKFHCAQPNGVAADHASGRPVWWTNNDYPATVGAVQLHLNDNIGMATNTTEILHNLSSGSDFMYDFVNNDNSGWVCTTPEEDCAHMNAINTDNLLQDDELDIILPDDDDTLMFVEELHSTTQ